MKNVCILVGVRDRSSVDMAFAVIFHEIKRSQKEK